MCAPWLISCLATRCTSAVSGMFSTSRTFQARNILFQGQPSLIGGLVVAQVLAGADVNEAYGKGLALLQIGRRRVLGGGGNSLLAMASRNALPNNSGEPPPRSSMVGLVAGTLAG